ncbi:hypothetical protein KC19_5G098500 [Ceratodon purpureus]|uniref:Protein kinase domain-containing protein n=1 Tax=Ceratodon purpureus TaxID=3225 RepID=A0A8T0I0L4_CERPU|nr:hypothetical protein KC19_5G098500 [Ceratodon purpureus]
MHILKYCHPGRSDHVERLLKRKEKGAGTGVNFVDLKLKGGKLQLKNQPTQSIFHNVPAICKRKYRMLAKKGEGTFSEVLKAQCIKSSKFVAIKCMKGSFKSIEQVTRMREIQALQRLSPHPNIIKLQEVLYDPPSRKLCLIFELMEMNVYELIRERRNHLPEEKIKSLMYQLVKAMDHMHRNGIFHRDVKPENILITGDLLKLADFGSCRGVYSKHPYTEYISTRWYRAPECLLTDGYYTYKMDMWGVGCVLFEIVSLFPLFPGNNELDQINKIHKILGTPPQALVDKMKRRSRHADFNFPTQAGTGIARLIPHASAACIELVNKLLAYDPDERLSARQALTHLYFKDLRDKDHLQEALHDASHTLVTHNVWNSSSKPNLAHLNAMNAKKHENPLNFTKSISTNSKKTMVTNMKYAINPNATCSLDFMSRISQIPECANNSKDEEEENGVNKDHSGFAGSPKAEREALLAGQHGHKNVDVTPAVPKHGDTSTKVIGAKFPSILPPIRNGRNNSTRLYQDPANVASKTQRLQNPKIIKGGAKILKPTKPSRSVAAEIVRKSNIGPNKAAEFSQPKKRVINSKTRLPAIVRPALASRRHRRKTPELTTSFSKRLGSKRLLPPVTKLPTSNNRSKHSRLHGPLGYGVS